MHIEELRPHGKLPYFGSVCLASAALLQYLWLAHSSRVERLLHNQALKAAHGRHGGDCSPVVT